MTNGGAARDPVCQAEPVNVPRHPGPSRRAVLLTAVAGGWLLGGCDSSGPPAPGPASPSTSPPDPRQRAEQAVREAAVTDEHALIARYRATRAAHPALAALLAVPLAQHEVHLRALGAPPASTPRPSGTPGPSGTLSGPAVPSDPATAVRALATMERAAARRRRDGCATATGTLAGLLGSIGACEAGHAVLLDAG